MLMKSFAVSKEKKLTWLCVVFTIIVGLVTVITLFTDLIDMGKDGKVGKPLIKAAFTDSQSKDLQAVIDGQWQAVVLPHNWSQDKPTVNHIWSEIN